jgi:hypothetical protein
MLALIVPPVAKPCEPLIGAYSLARLVRRQNLPVSVIDANLDWFHYQLWGPGRPATDPEGQGKPAGSSGRRLQRALRHTCNGNPLRDPFTYRVRDRYQQAVEHLETVLRGAAADLADERAGLADFRVRGCRPVSRQDLIAYQQRSTSIFDTYLKDSLVPQIIDMRPQVIGFSVTFLHQMFATMRMASILRRELPHIPLVLGGALVECWRGADWRRPPFDQFDAVIPLQSSSWDTWRSRFGLQVPYPNGLPFFPDPEDIVARAFFAPEPIVPLALGLGCAWGRCTFCPDYRRHPYQASTEQSWLQTLERVLEHHPALTLHLSDSCVAPEALDRLADAIHERALPVRWYAFVRLEKSLLQPGRLEQWVAGGCRLLQFGLETAATELLKAMHKGIQLRHAAAVLRRASDLGIRNYVYLLFGFPGETHDHQLQTLDFIVQHQQIIHYLNNAIFNLPKDSPIAMKPEAFSIRNLRRFPGETGDLSIYLDFDDGLGSARRRARSFLQQEFLAEPAVRQRVLALPPVFKSNHAIMTCWS